MTDLSEGAVFNSVSFSCLVDVMLNLLESFCIRNICSKIF